MYSNMHFLSLTLNVPKISKLQVSIVNIVLSSCYKFPWVNKSVSILKDHEKFLYGIKF